MDEKDAMAVEAESLVEAFRASLERARDRRERAYVRRREDRARTIRVRQLRELKRITVS